MRIPNVISVIDSSLGIYRINNIYFTLEEINDSYFVLLCDNKGNRISLSEESGLRELMEWFPDVTHGRDETVILMRSHHMDRDLILWEIAYKGRNPYYKFIVSPNPEIPKLLRLQEAIGESSKDEIYELFRKLFGKTLEQYQKYIDSSYPFRNE